ncbi:hypothetical protein [Acidithiobacillus ferridurans]|uniref:hypothetical protein n=1 Tax=Acidithiobacillus ferridurans TaxID=1232575 RepID=UPI001C072F30|nr:hypothetical protein [Acidithiobacillus ferridurans]
MIEKSFRFPDAVGDADQTSTHNLYGSQPSLAFLRTVITTPPIIIFTKRININKYIMYLKAISIPKNLNEKYTSIPTAGVMLQNKKYFIAFIMVFDIFNPPPMIC